MLFEEQCQSDDGLRAALKRQLVLRRLARLRISGLRHDVGAGEARRYQDRNRPVDREFH
jgi:hypothetical protein